MPGCKCIAMLIHSVLQFWHGLWINLGMTWSLLVHSHIYLDCSLTWLSSAFCILSAFGHALRCILTWSLEDIPNHPSVFLKFLEFLEDAHPHKTPNKPLHYWFGIWGPCVRYNSICLVSRINYPTGKTVTKILCHSSKDPSLGIPCSDQSLRHLCSHILFSFWFLASFSSEESRKL